MVLARKRFAMAVEAETNNRASEMDDLRFLAGSPDNNWQWPNDVLKLRQAPGQEGGIQPCLTINPLPQHVRQVTNEQRMNRPQIKVHPVDDKADIEVAEIFNGIIRHIEVASEADLAYDQACDAQATSGVGYFRISTQYCDEMSFDQEIVILPIKDRFKVYYDPHIQHPAGKDAKWAFVVEDIPREEYEQEYGKDHPIDWNLTGIGDQNNWFPSKDTVRIAEYYELDTKRRKLVMWEDGSTSFDDNPPFEGAKPMMRDGEEVSRETTETVCCWRKINGQGVLEETEIKTPFIPVVRVVGNEWIVDGKPVISGIVRNAKDAVRMYNYWASKETQVIALAPIVPFIGAAGQFSGFEERWKKANQVPYSFLEYNPVVDEVSGAMLPPPQRAIPALPQAGITQAKLAAADDVKKTTGFYDSSLGARSNETSGRAINARKVESDIGSFHYVDNLSRAIRHAGRIIVAMIPKYYDTKRIARIIGEDGEPDHVTVDPSIQSNYVSVTDKENREIEKIYNLGVGKYDVVVQTGPSYTTKRQETADFMTSAMQSAKDPAAAAVLTYLAMKNQDIAGADEAVKMLKAMLPAPAQQAIGGEENEQQIPPQVQAQMQAIGQAAQAMQAQLQQAGQALQERDDAIKDLKAKADGKSVDALAKMYEADKRALTELEKSQTELMIARANAATASAQAPTPETVQVIQAMDAMIADLSQKVAILAQGTDAIAQQLQQFEIASLMPA